MCQCQLEPTVTKTNWGKYLAVSHRWDDLKIGVFGDTEEDARRKHKESQEAIRLTFITDPI